MDEFGRHWRRLSLVVFFFLCLSLAAALIAPAWRTYAFGVALGSAAGWLNAFHLAWRIRRLTTFPQEYARKTRSTGFVVRASTALLAVVLTVRVGPERVSLGATIVGLTVVPILSFALGAFRLIAESRTNRRSAGRADEKADGGNTGSVSERGEDRHA